MTEPLIIDTKMHGFAEVTACFVISGERTALVETGPKSSLDNVLAGLQQNEIEELDWIIVTHIHLDHAGAAGTLARQFPSAKVAVHPVGAPHLADPSKLWKSAARIYGDDMDRLWGGIDPIAEGRIHVVEDGDKIDLGGRFLQAVETPGHAYHHHAFMDDATGVVFTGDALGVRLPEVGVIRPATPPPEFHLQKALDSIERLRALQPASLWLTHFGPHDRGSHPLSVDQFCYESADALRRWGDWVKEARTETRELDEAARIVRSHASVALEQSLSSEELAQLEQTTSYWMNTWGYMRYFDKTEGEQDT